MAVGPRGLAEADRRSAPAGVPSIHVVSAACALCKRCGCSHMQGMQSNMHTRALAGLLRGTRQNALYVLTEYKPS